jgi:Domain of unknown function (DUF4189)
MRFSKLFLGILFALIWESQCFGYGSISCMSDDAGYRCYGTSNKQTPEEATSTIASYCSQMYGRACLPGGDFENECFAIAIPSNAKLGYSSGRGETRETANQQALTSCLQQWSKVGSCNIGISICDVRLPPQPQFSKQNLTGRGQQAQVQSQPTPQPSPKEVISPEINWNFLSDPKFYQTLLQAKLYEDIRTGIGLGLGILIVILIYAKRSAIANFVIHGNLPYTIENRSDDIEVLFKRSQRLNWHGRVIFGLTAQLGMTEQQLLLVRRYRLGRVIAFDSLRRQKQNELAQLHLQLAAQVETQAKDDKPLSQLLASLWAVFLIFFWFIRALFSFFFGFLFLRVTIAKLVRGKLIEGFELKLLMEAKTAIEETAVYLKEYLLLAETFDGREEVYEPPA